MNILEGHGIRPGQKVKIGDAVDSVLKGQTVTVKQVSLSGVTIDHEFQGIKWGTFFAWEELEKVE